jgi:hypothetical protein
LLLNYTGQSSTTTTSKEKMLVTHKQLTTHRNYAIVLL